MNKKKGSYESRGCNIIFKIITAAGAVVAAAVAGGLYAEEKGSNESGGSSVMSNIITVAGAAVLAATVVRRLCSVLLGSGSGEPEAETTTDTTTQEKSRKTVKWTRPEADWMKFNVDGSVLHHEGNLAACGGVMRDADGKFRIGFARNLGSCDNIIEAELWGIMSALVLARTNNVRKLVIESDSEAAVRLVNEGCRAKHRFYNLVSQAQVMLRQDWQVRVEHIHRQGNRAANCMAKKGRSLPLGLHECTDPPEECVSFLTEDLM